jgi:DsbC/DsbD-like thiol-disulfide interchange protein
MDVFMRRQTAFVLAGLLLTGGLPSAQTRRPTAEVAVRVETRAPRQGGTIRLVAHVRLPQGLHVQSNKPRDPDLIPTDLTVTPPKGATVIDVVYPKASDLDVPGFRQPLAVYPNEFDIVVRVKLDPRVAAGALAIPATLRYQACNDSVCFPPARAAVTWTLQVAKG